WPSLRRAIHHQVVALVARAWGQIGTMLRDRMTPSIVTTWPNRYQRLHRENPYLFLRPLPNQRRAQRNLRLLRSLTIQIFRNCLTDTSLPSVRNGLTILTMRQPRELN